MDDLIVIGLVIGAVYLLTKKTDSGNALPDPGPLQGPLQLDQSFGPWSADYGGYGGYLLADPGKAPAK